MTLATIERHPAWGTTLLRVAVGIVFTALGFHPLQTLLGRHQTDPVTFGGVVTQTFDSTRHPAKQVLDPGTSTSGASIRACASSGHRMTDRAGPARVIMAISLRVYSRSRSPSVQRSRIRG